MRTLRTIFPYGLNEIARKYESEVPVGKLFFPIPIIKQLSARYRNNNDYLKNDSITDLFTTIHNIQIDIKDLFYKIRIILNNLHKQIASEIW